MPASDEDIYSLNGNNSQRVWTPLPPPCATSFFCQLHILRTNMSKKHQGHITIILLTFVFLPHSSASLCLDSIFIHTCQILHHLLYVSPSLSTSFLFHFLFHLITEFELELHFSQVVPNILFICSLANIHFHFCFEHMNPCFTKLCNQFLSLAVGSNFHISQPRQPQQPLSFCIAC